MSEILLSIIIPAYNSERFMHGLLSDLTEQVLECGKKIIEIIVVNDGSVDSTKDIVQLFSDKYSFISLVNQENKGECGARNTGIQKAQGRYLYFLDSDDALTKGSLSFFVDILLKNQRLDVFVFGFRMQKNGVVLKTVFSNTLDKKQLSSMMISKSFFSKEMPCCICSLIYRREFVCNNKLLFPAGVKIGGDLMFMINAFTRAKVLYYDNRICFVYQIRDDSVMQGYKHYSLDRMKSFELIRDIILNQALSYESFKKEMNFYIANLYLVHLVDYLKSDSKHKAVNRMFIENKFFLYKNLRGRFVNCAAIRIAGCIPLKLLFMLLK